MSEASTNGLNEQLVSVNDTGHMTLAGDFSRPYSYAEWIKRVTGLKDTETYSKYQEYVAEWTENKKKEETIADTIRSDYTDFVRSLVLYFDEEERKDFEKDVRWDEKLDLERLIPKFSTKIRDIIRYFADKRESVIRSKLKYNMHGAFISIERMLHEYLLSNFTKRKHYEQISDKSVLNVVPDLYDVNGTMTVRIREKYDDQNYFDKNPELGASAYFGGISEYASGENADLFKRMYGDWNGDEIWLFDGGLNDRKIDNPIFYTVRDAVLETSGLSGYEQELAINRYVYDLTKKYLGNDLAFVSGGYYVDDNRTYRYEFKRGNNWFYFPSGEMAYETDDMEIEPISIHDTTLYSVAHGGETYEDSDRIFVQTDSGLKGAWLNKSHYKNEERTISAKFVQGVPYSFHFPFPGYGISADEIPWGGPLYFNCGRDYKDYDSLQLEEQLAIQKLYWESNPVDFRMDAINLQRLDFPIQGAKPTFDAADHLSMRSWTDSKTDAVYTGSVKPYWYFSPERTELVVDACRSYFEYPHTKLETIEDESNFRDLEWCGTKALTGTNLNGFVGAVAGSCPAEADIIYRLDSANKPVEAAWLYSPAQSTFGNYTASGLCYCPGLAIAVPSGEDVYFLWTGESVSMDVVFPKHGEYEKYSPVAKGADADRYGNDYDRIVKVQSFPIPEESINVGVEEHCYQNNSWNGTFETGNLYKYHRAAKHENFYAWYAFSYDSATGMGWRRMRRTTDGDWEADVNGQGHYVASDMELRSGDKYVYDHVESTTITLSANDGEAGTLKIDHPSFAIRIPLAVNGHTIRPYWAVAYNETEDQTAIKAKDVHSNGVRFVSNVPLRNPLIADVSVSGWDILTYYCQNEEPVWTKQIDIEEAKDTLQWKKLSASLIENPFDPSKRKDLIKAVPLEEKSDITFEFIPGDTTLINYWAVNPFTWEQPFRNIKNGVPPSGGIYIEPGYNLAVEARYPYANLSNRHYPTMAVAQDASEFYEKEDVGGYFVPEYLGATVAISKHPEVVFDTNRVSKENSVRIITSGETFAGDEGFTKAEENSAMLVKSEDMDWMKNPVSVGVIPGMRRDNDAIQTFIPYQTEEENRAHENKGVRRPSDYTEPWDSTNEVAWDYTKGGYGYDKHITRQEPIKKWADERFEKKSITKVKSDIYGVQYALVKPVDDSDSIYEERDRIGRVYYRSFGEGYHDILDLNGYLSAYPILKNGWVYDIDTAYDTLICRGRFPNSQEAESIQTVTSGADFGDEGWHDKFSEWYRKDARPYLQRRFSSMSDAYGISELEQVVPVVEVGSAFEDVCLDIMNVYSNVGSLYLDEYTRRAFYKVGETHPWVNANEIASAMSGFDAMDADDAKNSIIGLCEALSASCPYRGGDEMFVSFPIVCNKTGNTWTAETKIGRVLFRHVPYGTKFSNGWFLNEQRKYIVPSVAISGDRSNLIVPEFHTIDMNKSIVSDLTPPEDSISAVSEKISGAVGGAFESWMMINPVCGYNGKTDSLLVVQQVSGAENEVGAFGFYEYYLLNDAVSAKAVVPTNVEDPWNKYLDARAWERENPGYEWIDDKTYGVATFYTVLTDGSTSAVGTTYYAIGGKLKPLFTLEEECRDFYAWSNNKDDENDLFPFNEPVMATSVNLYGLWKPKVFKVSFLPENGNRPTIVQVECGNSVGGSMPSAPAKVGKTFHYWKNLRTGATFAGTERIYKNTIVQAVYTS